MKGSIIVVLVVWIMICLIAVASGMTLTILSLGGLIEANYTNWFFLTIGNIIAILIFQWAKDEL